MAIVRATTPIHSFIFQEDPSLYSQILVTYTQDKNIVMELKKEDLTIEQINNDFCSQNGKYRAWYRMSQEDTKKFSSRSGSPVCVQVRVLTESGEALASEKRRIYVQNVLNDEVLV